MGRIPGGSQSQDGFNKGAWTPQEDKILTDYVKVHGEGKWSNLARKTGLKRCGKSCRLRWMNYLRPDIKRGNISYDEEELIIRLHKLLGNRWSLIAGRLPGRTDNEIKNYWNTTLSKKKNDFSFAMLKPKISTSCTDNDLFKFGTNHKFTSVEAVFVDTATQCSDQNVNGTNHTLVIEAAEAPPQITHIAKDMKIEPENVNNDGEDFMIDFNVEDICKFLDTDMMNDVNEGEESTFFEVVADAASSDDLLSLASLFLESDEGWPEDHDLNINVSNMNIIDDGNS